MAWQLERPEPAFPISYCWTWDHSTNWVLDDPGVLNFGCNNAYIKQPETYLEDYRRLTDFAAGLGIGGIVIWGFLRDSHGGVEYAKQVAEYAAARGVKILPGVGTTAYGGIYYDGEHRYHLPTFLKHHPEAYMIDEDGQPILTSACPSNPAFRDWLSEGMQWLFREFPIGGVNIENGDFMVCHCPACQAHKASWTHDEPDYFRQQTMSYVPALAVVAEVPAEMWLTYATYCGFIPGDNGLNSEWNMLTMECERPSVVDLVPQRAIAQWTLTNMLRGSTIKIPEQLPLPLLAYLENGAPPEALDTPQWPQGVKPPAGVHNVCYMHQASQFHQHEWVKLGDRALGRYDLAVSSIKEGCLRAYRAGLEGIAFYGEVTPRHIPYALNYLAFSHFIHWPEDSLRAFGRKTLGQVFEDEEDGEVFAELLAYWESKSLSAAHRDEMGKRFYHLRGRVSRGDTTILDRFRFWYWLYMRATTKVEQHTAGFF